MDGYVRSGTAEIGIRVAEMLMKVAQHPGLRNSHHLANLPPSCTALYELAYADPQFIEKGIAEGRINPQMTAAQARAFARGQPADAAHVKADAASFNLDKRLKVLNRLVLKEANRWSLEHRQQLAELLTALAHKIVSNPIPSDRAGQ